ncbi:hypothetical protein PV326_008851 [Microctonus aethiopoides]|nr:hypothetical protein PV326_008851 [Microctonus aethiopoides]
MSKQNQQCQQAAIAFSYSTTEFQIKNSSSEDKHSPINQYKCFIQPCNTFALFTDILSKFWWIHCRNSGDWQPSTKNLAHLTTSLVWITIKTTQLFDRNRKHLR